ncbi:MAG: sulfatase-like hydrolase/transferase [Halopseudomonas sp.]
MVFNNFGRLAMIAVVSGALLSGGVQAASGNADGIIYDAEFIKVQGQYAEQWANEDSELNKKLAEMRKKYGKSPNILHIMWDDNSLGEVGVPLMNEVLGFDTPRINQMASEGMSFARMYTEPSCTPTRTAALTGRLSVRAGMYKVGFPPDGMGLHADEVTMAEVLSPAGYETVFIGKAHQGDIQQSYMTHQGFDYANFSMYNQFPFITWQVPAANAGAVQGLFPFQWDKNYTLDKQFRPLGYVNQLEGRKGEDPKLFMGTGYADYKEVMRAHQQQVVDFLDNNKPEDKPFYMAYWPHVYDAALKPSEKTTSANTWFAEGLVGLDRDIGEILDKLKEKGLAENTLVIAMADNGPMHELAPIGPHEVLFRGGKGDYLEGGIRVPAFAWWPGVIAEGQTVGDMISVHDLFTTFARLGEAMDQIPTDRVIDGIDQTALLLNGKGHSRRDYLHIYTGDFLAATIKQQFKRVWVGDKPGLVGDSFYDLYKDEREEHASMPQFLWAWAAFDHMKTRHEQLNEQYPHRPPTHGRPYVGIVDLPAEAKALADTVPVHN